MDEQKRNNERIDQWFTDRGIPLPEWDSRNWYADESANAMLLEAMPTPMLGVVLKQDSRGTAFGKVPMWVCAFPDGSADHADRKTAIVLAFLKFMEAHPKGKE